MSAKTYFLPTCLSCADHCCNGDILVAEEERRRIIERWKNGDPFGHDERFDYYYLDIEECPFLAESGLCAIHDVRPAMCRLYPFSIVPLKTGSFRLHLDKSCPVGPSIPPGERKKLREIAARFLEEVGRRRFLAFYESW